MEFAEISFINDPSQVNSLIDDIIANDNLFYDDHSDWVTSSHKPKKTAF
jgi:hypothetical protein